MSTPSPSVRERRLAAELRRLRLAAELTGQDVAAATGWSASKVSRIENGRIGIAAGDLDRLIELYGLPPEPATALRRLAPAGPAHGWWEAWADSLSSGYAALLRLEAGSTALRSYCAVLPHPLLMTPDYVRQVVRSTWQRPSTAEVERRVEVCRRRQAVLDRATDPGPLQLSVVLDEAVLRRAARAAGPAGDPRVGGRSEDDRIRREQLEHLIAAADRPGIDIRVLPFAAGIPPVSAGSFSLLESTATGAPDVVYLENKTRISFVDSDVEVDRYARDHRLLTEMALSPASSLEVLRDAASMADGVSGSS